MKHSEPGSPITDPEPKAVAGTTGSSVLRGGFWNVASVLLPQIYLLVLSIVAARFLGPENMGRQSFIAFIALSATALFGGGIVHDADAVRRARCSGPIDLERSGASCVGVGAGQGSERSSAPPR